MPVSDTVIAAIACGVPVLLILAMGVVMTLRRKRRD